MLTEGRPPGQRPSLSHAAIRQKKGHCRRNLLSVSRPLLKWHDAPSCKALLTHSLGAAWATYFCNHQMSLSTYDRAKIIFYFLFDRTECILHLRQSPSRLHWNDFFWRLLGLIERSSVSWTKVLTTGMTQGYYLLQLGATWDIFTCGKSSWRSTKRTEDIFLRA